jgi:hypothetical protein
MTIQYDTPCDHTPMIMGHLPCMGYIGDLTDYTIFMG